MSKSLSNSVQAPSEAMAKRIEVGKAIRLQLVELLTTEEGVHAETIVAAAGRLAGSLLFRTFNLPFEGYKPGATVLTDIANTKGPELLDTFGEATEQLEISLSAQSLAEPIPEEHQPLSTVIDQLESLTIPVAEIGVRYGMSLEETAHSCAIAAALLVRDVSDVLDSKIAARIVVYGLVEGTKTVPPKLVLPCLKD